MKVFVLPSFVLGFTACCLFNGCVETPKPDRSGSSAEARMERVLKAPPLLRGSAAYFDGSIRATLSVSNGMNAGGGGKGGEDRVRGSKGGGGEMHAGMGGGGGERRRHSRSEDEETGSDIPQAHVRESPMPSVILRVEFENLSDKPVKLSIWELNSELGNFAVRPDTLNIAPGEKAHPDSMISRLGLTSSAVPVSLILRLSGKEEKKVITLTPAEPPVTVESGNTGPGH